MQTRDDAILATANAAPHERPPRSAWLKRWSPVLLAAFVFALFARTLSYGYYLDDHEFARPWTTRQVLDAFAGPFDPLRIQPDYFRPFVGVSFALDWKVWGYTKWGYHLTNVVLHTAATLLVYAFLRRLRVRWWAALAAAATFAALPSNAATAIYVAERSDAMAMICIACGLLVVHAYYRTRQPRWLLVLSAIFVLALLSKEIGIALPMMVAMYWWYLDVADAPAEGGEVRRWWHSLVAPERRRGWLMVVGPLIAITIGYLLYRWAVMPSGSLSNRFAEAANPARGLIEGIANTFRGVPWEVDSWSWPALIAAVALAVVIAPRSTGWRTVVLGLGLVLGGCLPLAYSGGAEPRLLYVSSLGLVTLLAGVATVVADGLAARKRLGADTTKFAVAGAVVALAFIGTTAITTIKSQDQFEPGSDKKLGAELQIWNAGPTGRALFDPRYIEEMRQDLVNAGLITDTGP
jgi:hypothetical protein